MGGDRVTIQNLEVVQVVPEKNVILIKGNVPGAKKSLITINQQLKLVNNKEGEYSQMANVTLFDQTGKQAGEVVLNDAIFGIEPNQSVVFDVIISQRASPSSRNSRS